MDEQTMMERVESQLANAPMEYKYKAACAAGDEAIKDAKAYALGLRYTVVALVVLIPVTLGLGIALAVAAAQ